MMIRRLAILVLLSAALIAAGCSSSIKLGSQYLDEASPWPYYHGDTCATGCAIVGDFSGRLNIVWESEMNGKPAGPLTIQCGMLAVPSTKSRIDMYDIGTGEKLGKIKTRGPVQSGMVKDDEYAYYAVGLGDKVTCFDLRMGTERWERYVKDASRGSIIVEDRLLVGSATGRLTAYDLQDGSSAWVFTGEDDRFTAPAAAGHGLVFQPGAGGHLYALNPEDGAEVYRVKVGGPMVSAVAVTDLVIGADMLGHVYGIDPKDGEIRWSTDISGPIWTKPAVAEGRVFVGHSGGELVALSLLDGRVLWRFQAFEVITASAMVLGRYVVVGTLGGHLYVLDAADGSVLSRRKVEGRIDQSPVTDGDHIYIATDEGKVICLGDRNDAATAQADQRIDSEHESERISADHRPGIGDGLSQGEHIRPKPSDGAAGR